VATQDGRGGLIALVMHRQGSSGEFSDEDRAALAAVAPLLAVACARHVELIVHGGADAPTWRLRLASAYPDMSSRELDVASCLLANRTMRETAAALGIAHSSVVTYSERVYARLCVRNLRELRARFAGLVESTPRLASHRVTESVRHSA
jgi:DNA-binding CsgD family transcriptional regulator